MGDKSGIEWTDATWNPTTGCDHVSEGCTNCYAEQMAKRLAGRAGYPADQPFRLTLHPGRLDQPLRWRRPRLVFVNSMSDLFHPSVPDDFIGQVFDVMMRAEQHTFQVLTKRPQRMSKFVRLWLGESWAQWLPNLWLGTSIESDRFCFRADHLRETPAAVRFLSCEPLLGPLPSLDLSSIDWLIAGGESGPRARPMQPEWARDLRDRCKALTLPFLFKQWGTWLPFEPDAQPPFWAGQDGDLIDGHHLPVDLSEGEPTSGWWAPVGEGEAIFRRAGKHEAGRVLDGETWDEYPATDDGLGTYCDDHGFEARDERCAHNL